MFVISHLFKIKLTTIHMIVLFSVVTVSQFWLIINLDADSNGPGLPSSYGAEQEEVALLDNNYWSEQDKTDSESQCNDGKKKFMLIKNAKTGGSTIESILLQIATHYHLYEVVHTRGTFRSMKQESDKVGYYIPRQQEFQRSES
ncbi:uncharacterized protein LOC142344999 [Convolutriloba macropyga]|uniref:uncharacterized protein LOC142344999 n=1 Tax=Convolutriloba macropyga TaxID=536237 RepID=UPI003F52399D